MNKVIIIDSGVVLHRSIFAWGAEKKRRLEKGESEDPIPASYTYLNTCYSILKKIGIDKEDIIIVAQDGRNSWRKAFLEAYKGQRQGLRDTHEEINWDLQYKLINNLETQLNDSTNWHFIKLENIFNYADLALTDEGQRLKIEDYGNFSYDKEFSIESDDIQAIACKYFNDKEVILVTIDEDLSQLYYFSHVKIFSPNLKSPTNKAKIGFYKVVNEPLNIIAKKVRLGDKSDNILVDKHHDTTRDVEVRQFIIDLINLPDFIEYPIVHALNKLDWDKKVQYSQLPFQNSLAKKFDKIYEQDKIRTWEESVERHELKEKIKKEKANAKSKKKKGI